MGNALIVFDPTTGPPIAQRVQAQFEGRLLRGYQEGLQQGFDVTAEVAPSLLAFLRNELGCTCLVDLTAVDYAKYPEAQPARFGVIYILLCPETGARVKVRAFVADSAPRLATAVPLFAGADWAEREVFDFFGIAFEGHPNLKRILLPDGYRAHPLRKGYPLRGKGERADFEVYRAFTG